ncbi:DUF3037 domain-containing protein [Eikenella halliae]|uniref:DUF3037 domain-containing protein n=1 Tax=Eikenella halliae TaxID=1795832 RepID=UPI00370D8975
MNKLAMRFAVIRFMPYVQTREFANIGIVLTCPQTGYFNYKIEPKYARLSRFFRHFSGTVYRTATLAFANELERIKQVLEASYGQPEAFRAALDHIARPREAIILTGEIGVTSAVSEEQELFRLFDYYVCHSFAKDQPEAVLTRQIQAMVRNLKPAHPFYYEETLGDKNGFHAKLPIVQKEESGKVLKIIKPIYFGQKDPAEIYHKSDAWLAKIKRLRQQGYIERPAILFPYMPPENPERYQQVALNTVLKELADHDIYTVPQADKQAIAEFAMA